MNTANIKVSVITPVHNGEPYLAQCIESVLAQTHQNFDYTIVNNASTDSSLAIAQDYAQSDDRIRVVDNERLLPQIDNINHALGYLAPDSMYCKPAYADDLLDPAAIERMVAVAERDPSIAIVSAYESFGTLIGSQGLPYGTEVVSGREACRLYLLEGALLFGSPHGLLFRSDAVRRRQPFFRYDGGYYEDIETCFDLLRAAQLGFVHQVLSYTRRDNISTISGIAAYSPLRMLELLMLHRHGRAYLSPGELRARWNKRFVDYRRFLGLAALKGREPEFWDYHRRGLEKMELRIGSGALCWQAFQVAVDYALNPKATCEKLWRRWRDRSLLASGEGGGGTTPDEGRNQEGPSPQPSSEGQGSEAYA